MENFDMNKLVKVTNRSSGMAIYRIPERNIRRQFVPGESKMIPYEELVQPVMFLNAVYRAMKSGKREEIRIAEL